ncbi:MAG: PaaI family thioesterase [Pseudomonadota bacterium]
MARETLSLEEVSSFLTRIFAPWVQQLNIRPVELTDQGMRFIVPAGDDLSRIGGIVCGQAVSAIADTAGVLTLIGHNADDRIMTTVDMTTHFMRPLRTGDIEAAVHILSNGRRMATCRVDFRQAGTDKVCAGATCAYAYVDG